MLKRLVVYIFLTSTAFCGAAKAQTGLYPYGSFDTPGFDTIDRGSLNVHFTVPLVSKQGRGVGFQYSLVYDGLVWSPSNASGVATWTPAVGFGLHGQANEGFEGYLSFATTTVKCYQTGGSFTFQSIYKNYVYHDAFGASHPFAYVDNECTGTITGSGAATDNSGFSYAGGNVVAPDGRQIALPANSQSGSGNVTDANGNTINNHGNGTFTDTLGTTVLTIAGSGTASSPRSFTYNTPTGTQQAIVTYKTYAVQTAFGCGSVSEFNLSQDLVDKITLPDGSVYTFGYEQTPGVSSHVTGRLATLTLPQGGVISYTYSGANAGIVCADGTPIKIARTGGVSRTYARTAITATSSHTEITDASSPVNYSEYDFVMAGTPEAFYETNRNVYQGGSQTGTLLLARQTFYNASAHPCIATAISLPITRIDDFNSFNGSGLVGSEQTYNAYGLQTNQINYDFGAPGAGNPRGAIIRQETWAYPATGIVNLVSSDTVVDGPGPSPNTISLTTYAYDETTGSGHAALVTTSVPQHSAAGSQRGNLTTVTQSASPGTTLTTAATYEDTGNPVSVWTPSGTATYAYDGPTHTFTYTSTPPTPSSGVSLASTATYDANSGVPLTAVDPNSQTVTYKTYDPLLRPTEIDYPDGGKSTLSYSPTGMGMYRFMTGTTHTNTETNHDAYGRLNWVAVQNASGGYYFNNYCYDANGNLTLSAYRFAGGSISCSNPGDTFTYDALGRVLTVTHADSSHINYAYTGRATQVSDENGVSRIVQSDGLGRPSKVCEISGTTLQGVAPAACGLDIAGTGFLTTYAYSTDTSSGNALKTVVTQGAQTRTFETDWLGRTTQVIQPESGTTTYSYTYSTTAGLGLIVTRVRPQANQTGSATTTTTTQYDSLNRVVSIIYSDGTTERDFEWDKNTHWVQVGTNLKGRIGSTGGGSGANWRGSSMSYDVMGRVTTMWQCGPSSCGTQYQASRPLTFAYDLAGNLIQESDTQSGTINYGISIAGEITSITNATYQTLPQNPPNLVSNVVNGANGPVSYTIGSGLNIYQSYDTLGRLAGRWVCSGPAAQYCAGGTQVYGTTGQWKGTQMQYQSDTALNQQVTYGYGDGFNRLTSRTVTQGTVQNYNYAYDRYGNRTQTALNGGFNFNPTYAAATNRITTSGYTYDAAGNMTSDSVHTYTYDAEGNITKVDGGTTAQYVYDVYNHRIHVQTASGTTEFTFDYAGRRVSSWVSPNNAALEGRVYWGGQLVAFRTSDGLTYFDHQDTLGTERWRTNYAGYEASAYQSLPWGDGYASTIMNGSGDQDNEHYAGLERDAESGTEHAQFRNYASAQGRWLAPDSYMGSYDLTNPQSMNRYSYVLNNPVSFVDPLGLDPTCSTDPDTGDTECTSYFPSCGTDPSAPGCSGPNLCDYNPMLCYIPPGYPGGPPTAAPGGSGGGGGQSGYYGPPRTAILSAPSKGQTWKEFGQAAKSCAASSFGLSTAAAGGAVAAGTNALSTAGKFAGMTPGTSAASSFFRAVLPQAIESTWAPTLMNPLATSGVLGGVVGRWVPVVGEAILVVQGGNFVSCLWASDDNY